MFTTDEIKTEFAQLMGLRWADYCEMASEELARHAAEDALRSGQERQMVLS